MPWMERTAQLSPGGVFRTRLDRTWDRRRPRCAWVCGNPSKADAEQDDPSVLKMIGFSSRAGYGGFSLFNVLAFRATDPRELLAQTNPYGPDNEPWRIAQLCKEVSGDPPIIAWGNLHKRFWRGAIEVARALSVVRCLGFCTADPQWPRHPLMLPYSTRLLTVDASRWICHPVFISEGTPNA